MGSTSRSPSGATFGRRRATHPGAGRCKVGDAGDNQFARCAIAPVRCVGWDVA